MPAEGATSAEIMERMPEPKPALTTLLTFLTILKKKAFVSSEKIGKAQRFRAEVSKEAYTHTYMKEMKQTFFGGSFPALVSFFAKEEQLSDEEVAEIIDIIKECKMRKEK